MHEIVLTTLPALEGSTYLHFELIVPSNADFSIQGDTASKKLRESIITATSARPVQLVMSSKDGLTTNALGFVKWLLTLARTSLSKLDFFVSRPADTPLQITAPRYLEAYELLQQHDDVSGDDAHLYATELAFLGVQLDTSQNKIA